MLRCSELFDKDVLGCVEWWLADNHTSSLESIKCYSNSLLNTSTGFCFSITPPGSSEAICKNLYENHFSTPAFSRKRSLTVVYLSRLHHAIVILEFDTKKIVVSLAEWVSLYLPNTQTYINASFPFLTWLPGNSVTSDSSSLILSHHVSLFLTSWFFSGEL